MVDALPRISTHLGYFGSGGDRYNLAGYQEAVPPLERIRRVSQVQGLTGVELNYPALVSEETVDDVKAALQETGLVVSNVSLNVWGAGKWGLGSLTHPEPAIRADAIELMKRGMAVAKAVGSPLVSFWPGQDGFDYPFETDYLAAVDWFVAGLREVAASDRHVRICLEYKPKEPRTHLLLDTAGRSMWLIGKVNAPNVGVLLDLGHAFYAYENVAQSAALLHREGLLDLIHFSDNYGEWDWDMIPGTVRFWEHLELIFWLRELKYDKWYSIDIMMPRGDPVQACQQSVTNIQRLYRLAEKLDREQILANLSRPGHPENLRLVSDTVFGALGVS
jgi:xylose isomerase